MAETDHRRVVCIYGGIVESGICSIRKSYRCDLCPLFVLLLLIVLFFFFFFPKWMSLFGI